MVYYLCIIYLIYMYVCMCSTLFGCLTTECDVISCVAQIPNNAHCGLICIVSVVYKYTDILHTHMCLCTLPCDYFYSPHTLVKECA